MLARLPPDQRAVLEQVQRETGPQSQRRAKAWMGLPLYRGRARKPGRRLAGYLRRAAAGRAPDATRDLLRTPRAASGALKGVFLGCYLDVANMGHRAARAFFEALLALDPASNPDVAVMLADLSDKGVAARIAQCPVCRDIFLRSRRDQPACSPRCANLLRVRRWRATAQQYKAARVAAENRREAVRKRG